MSLWRTQRSNLTPTGERSITVPRFLPPREKIIDAALKVVADQPWGPNFSTIKPGQIALTLMRAWQAEALRSCGLFGLYDDVGACAVDDCL
jgi:hypothetical protein